MDEGWRRDEKGNKYQAGADGRLRSKDHIEMKELTCWQKLKKCLFGTKQQEDDRQKSIESSKLMVTKDDLKGQHDKKKTQNPLYPSIFKNKQKMKDNYEMDPNNPSTQELYKSSLQEKYKSPTFSAQPKSKISRPKKNTQPSYEYDQPPLIVVKPQIACQIQRLSQSFSPIENSEEFPYNRIGCLIMNFNKKSSSGTGTVVGSKYVLTAGHNLVDRLTKTECDSIIFKLRYKNYNNLHEFDKAYKVKSFKHLHDQNLQGLKNNSVEYDYAFLELDTKQDLEEFNCFKFNLKQVENNEEERVIISYPIEEKIIKFLECKGNVIFQEKQALYQLHLDQGSSGAALLTIDNDDYFITGIHSGIVIAGQNNQKNLKETKFRGGPIFTNHIFCELMQFMAGIEGSVDLKNKLIGSKGCSLLRQCLKKQLISLNLTNNQFGIEGCKELAKSEWQNLKTLNLSNNQLGQNECLKVLKDAIWPSLTELILSHNRIDSSGCQWLRQTNFPNLKILNINYNNISNEGCLEISQAQWPFLTHIYLYWNRIETQGCSYIANANWPKLTFIDIHENFVDHEGCKYIASAHWPQLKEIILDKNVIGDEGCRYLKNAQWPQLQRLHLWRNSIEEQGFQEILTSDWPNLKFINLSQSSVQNPQKFQSRLLQKHQGLELIL